MSRSVWRIGVIELRRRPGTERELSISTPVEGLAITTAHVPADSAVSLEGVLEAIEGAITLSARITAPWEGECRRCLDPVTGLLELDVSEVFEAHPTEGETYPIEGDDLDVEPVVRDAVLLHLPLAPLCRPDCPGPAPDAFPTSVEGSEGAAHEAGERPPDPRWAGLEQLKFD
jgi:uncharacterized protein